MRRRPLVLVIAALVTVGLMPAASVSASETRTTSPAHTSPARPAPAPVTGVKTYDAGTNVSVEWTNPATRFRRVIVALRGGFDRAEGPSRPVTERRLRRPKATSVTLHHLAKGTTYTVAVWTRGDAGRTSSAPGCHLHDCCPAAGERHGERHDH